MRSLEEQLTGPEPLIWDPEEGDSILGEIEAVGTRDGEYGPFTVYTLLDADGTPWNVAALGTVFARKAEELNPQIGDTIGVKYLGQREPKKGGGKPYHDYRVVIKRAERVGAAAALTGFVADDAFGDDDADI